MARHHRSSGYSDVGRLQLPSRGKRGIHECGTLLRAFPLGGEEALRLLAEIDVVEIHGIRATVPFLDGCHILRRC
jgi:hypothetical protein